MRPTNEKIAREYARTANEEQVNLLRTLAQIPAPTGHEGRRAAFVRDWLVAHGCDGAHVDDEGNVVCPLGPATGRRTVLSAHTDVVFDDADELPLIEKDGRMYAPGVGDDTANLVNVMMVAAWLAAHQAELTRPVMVVANTCEEGLGNLAGTRALYDAHAADIERHVAFDLYLGQCISSAVGSHRWRIRVRTQGGHSWADFGRPSAIHELCRLLCELCSPTEATAPDTTFNVGRIEGGTTVNSIAASAEALYEYRSTSQASLAAMRGLLEATAAAHRRADVEVELEPIGMRPGNGDVDAGTLGRLEATCADCVRAMTGAEPDRSPASTDANIPLSLGIPAVCVGSVTGALLHTRDEWVDASSLEDGLALALGIALELVGPEAL